MALTRRFAAFLSLSLLFCAALAPAGFPAESTDGFVVMTFNLRYDNPGDGPNAWPNRKEMAAATVRFHEADVVGMQEALRGQISDLITLLPGYGWFGVGRDDGKDAGEFNPVFYRRDKLRVIEQATFWLSATPEVPGSRGWDGACNRIVTWARFEEIATGRSFHVFNTHFDHVGEVARRESAGLLLRRIAAIAGSGPAVVTGDFNCPPEGEPYRILVGGVEGGAALIDARTLSAAPAYGGRRSFSGFKPVTGPGEIIDHIFVRGGVSVLRSGIIADTWDGRFVSDHFPVLAEIRLPSFDHSDPSR
jgi:endonuclease/exonuclease/phosphatase family metal-dependent hydrolase